MRRAIVLYIPVIHRGYIDFFERHKKESDTLFIIGDEFIAEFEPLHKEIRALKPQEAKSIIEKMGIFERVEILTKKNSYELSGIEIIASEDALSRRLAGKYLTKNKILYDTAFLRWDESNVLSQTSVNYDRISENIFDQKIMEEAKNESGKSSDWWRHVGAIIVRNEKVLISSHNAQVPTEQAPYMNGDPRDFIKAGTNSEFASAIHGEQMAIAEAARRGISLEGSDIYLTVFPCPACAKLIAYSGIKRVFFASGHASLDGEKVLKANKIELVFVK